MGAHKIEQGMNFAIILAILKPNKIRDMMSFGTCVEFFFVVFHVSVLMFCPQTETAEEAEPQGGVLGILFSLFLLTV